MALSPLEQTIGAINGASRIVIAPAADMGGDVIGGAYALGSALEEASKEVCVLLPEEVSSRLSFLPAPKNASSNIPFEREFTISINTNAVPVKELRYEQHEDALRLYLTAPSHFSREHLLFEAGPHKHDLVITVGAVDLEALGGTFERYPQMFSDISLLNIDHHAANERFGHINLVDVTASTVSEILQQFLERWRDAPLTEGIATCLLTGIIDGTKSFQDVSVTPRTLEAAAKLLSCGANQTEVVRHLYKSRSISHLRLWGRILGKLSLDETRHLGYAALEDADFSSVACAPKDLPQTLEDLHTHFSHLATIALFFLHQRDTEINALPTGLVSTTDVSLRERIVQKFVVKQRGGLLSFHLQVAAIEDAPGVFLQECFG